MIMTLLVVLAVSSALMIGAAWGVWGSLSPPQEGFLIALAGGALLESLILELIDPSVKEVGLLVPLAAIAAGALVFAGIDYVIDEKWGSERGGGLLAAVTLDGVPENLALGVALISARPAEVLALAGSIFLSNLPEAAGGAREMAREGKTRAFLIWAGAAALLSAAAVAGNTLLSSAPGEVLAGVRCFAAGAVVASLATEVFPKAFQEDRHLAGVATCIGLIVALLLGEMGKA